MEFNVNYPTFDRNACNSAKYNEIMGRKPTEFTGPERTFERREMPFGYDRREMPFGFERREVPFGYERPTFERREVPFGYERPTFERRDVPIGYERPTFERREVPIGYERREMTPFGYDRFDMPWYNRFESREYPFGYDRYYKTMPYWYNRFDRREMPVDERCYYPESRWAMPTSMPWTRTVERTPYWGNTYGSDRCYPTGCDYRFPCEHSYTPMPWGNNWTMPSWYGRRFETMPWNRYDVERCPMWKNFDRLDRFNWTMPSWSNRFDRFEHFPWSNYGFEYERCPVFNNTVDRTNWMTPYYARPGRFDVMPWTTNAFDRHMFEKNFDCMKPLFDINKRFGGVDVNDRVWLNKFDWPVFCDWLKNWETCFDKIDNMCNINFRPSHPLECYTIEHPLRILDREGNREIYLCFNLCGYKPAEVNCTFNRAERCIVVEATHDIKEGKEHSVSRKFYRKFVLPTTLAKVDLSKCEIKCCFSDDGLLHIELPLPKMTTEEWGKCPTMHKAMTTPTSWYNNYFGCPSTCTTKPVAVKIC